MASRTLAGGLALKGDWALGEDNWKDEHDLNLLKLSVLAGKTALNRVSATPGAPAEGAVYIFKADHPTQPNKVAVYDEGAWVYITPTEGWEMWSAVDLGMYRYTTALGWAAVTSGGGGAWYAGHVPLVADFPTMFGTVSPTLTNDADLGLNIDLGAPANGDVLRLATKAIATPAADWSVTALLNPSVAIANYSGVGLAIFDSVANRALVFGRYSDNALTVQRRSSPSGWNSSPVGRTDTGGLCSPLWAKIMHVGANYNFLVSGDGKNFVLFYTESDTNWLTNKGNYIGLGGSYARPTGSNAYLSVPYWTQSW